MYQVEYTIMKALIRVLRHLPPPPPTHTHTHRRNVEKEMTARFFRKHGVTIGEDCVVCSNICSSESFLITIGDRVTISNGVQLITHDNSVDRVLEGVSDIFGEVKIGNDCFIGARATILPGVTLADRIIVGAGSVVTKTYLESGIVIAGNPAKKICSWEQYADKYAAVAFDISGGKMVAIKKHPEKILRNRK